MRSIYQIICLLCSNTSNGSSCQSEEMSLSWCNLNPYYFFYIISHNDSLSHKDLTMAILLVSENSYEVKWSEVAQSCRTLCGSMDCSPTGYSVHGIFQARVLEWGAISFSRGSSRPRDRTPVSCIVGRYVTVWATIPI